MKIVKRESSRIEDGSPVNDDDPVFGTLFTDHMFSADWSDGQWRNAV